MARMPNRAAAHAINRPVKKHHYILWTVLFLLLVAVGAAGCAGYTFYKQAMAVKDHEMAVVEQVKSIQDLSQLKDPATLANMIPEVQKHTSAAREITQGTLWELAEKVPTYGEDIQTVRGMVKVVDELAQTSLPKLSDTLTVLLDADLSTDGKVNLTPISKAQTGFNEANGMIQQQVEELKSLPTPHIDVVKSAYDQSVKQFQSVSDKIDKVNSMLQVVPNFLGANGARTYLIIASTNSEARSGGGLIGSLGTMTADHGVVTMGDFHPNTEFVPLGAESTSSEEALMNWPLDFSFDIRDQMAKPNFSQVATSVNDIWQRSRYAGQIDGVMAIDPVFIQEMVRVSGNITLDNGTVLTGDNTAEFLLNTIYKDVPVSMQDSYFEFAASEAMHKMFSGLTLDKMIAMAKTLTPMAQNRHLYMYSFHEDEAAHFQGAGLAKEAPNSEENPSVGVYMNEQNASKLDWYIHRTSKVTRQSCNADGSQTYHVTFTMTNTIPETDLSSGNSYILGGAPTIASPGVAVERMLFYPPAGGSISNLQVTAGQGGTPVEATMDDQALWTSVAYISAGETVTYQFDVTTSPKSVSDLTLDQSPAGSSDPGVTYDTAACAIAK